MNERIRQLAEQCESFGSWHNKTYSFDKEKFAKLIVQECAGLAEDGFDDELDGQEICDRIKQYFGVE